MEWYIGNLALDWHVQEIADETPACWYSSIFVETKNTTEMNPSLLGIHSRDGYRLSDNCTSEDSKV